MEVLQVPSELEAMTALYVERKPQRVLEIGSWDGGTLKVWLELAVPKANVVAIDLEHRNADAYPEWVRKDVTLTLHVGSSLTNEGQNFIRDNGPYDWAFIDGDHGVHGVNGDITIVQPLVVNGGLMLLHDITPPTGEPTNAPLAAFERLGEEFKTWTFQDWTPASWTRGIGVVQL